ncbi:MAG: hypothetical protein ACC662_02230, partial [Planctomycetota bacterium]
TAGAMQSYRGYFGFDGLEFVDPHLRYQALLKIQGGASEAREVYYEMKRRRKDATTVFAWDLLLDPKDRIPALEGFLEEHPDFAPAWYALSRDFSVARLGTQSMEDKREEKRLLERFLKLRESGPFLRYYLDQTVAAGQVEDARERLAALRTLSDAVLEKPVSITANRSNAGWMVAISIADAAKEIFYRLGTEGEFKSTGFVPGVMGRNGLPLPRPLIPLGARAAKTTIQIKYQDVRGREHGPYDVLFVPVAMQLAGTKSTLELTKNSWLAFRDMGEDRVLVYFTQLLSHRGALEAIRYGVDVEAPDRDFAFSPADPRNPYAMNPNDTIYLDVPPETEFVTVQLTFADGTKSEVVRFDR